MKNSRKKYRVYGQYYNWTHNLKQARKWAKEWDGIITVEIKCTETRYETID